MQRNRFVQILVCVATTFSVVMPVVAQMPSAPATAIVLPATASAKKADEFLSTLKPPTSVQALASGNDLLFEVPDVAAAGQVRVKLTSTMPRTDGLWLMSMSPQPESGISLLAAVTLGISALPEVSLLLTLNQTQTLLLVARAGGKYYGIQREVKIGELTSTKKKP